MMNKILLKFLYGIFFVTMAWVFAGCHPGIKEETGLSVPVFLEKLTIENYPLFADSMDFKNLAVSIDHSLAYFKKLPQQRKYRYGKDYYSAAHMIDSLNTFKLFLEKKPSVREVNEFIQNRFSVYAAAGNKSGDVLFTGYFEPTYDGSLEKSEGYAYPLYSKPKDLLEIDLSAFSDKYKGHKRLMAMVNDAGNRVVPYFSRKQINAAKDFFVRSRPVVWLRNRVDRFFLEIQGSGRIILDKGGMIRVHYAGSNGNPYRSIGRYLIDKNEILKENMSMQAIRTWLEFHPQRMDEVLNQNGSFVFFRQEEGGPFGSLGVEVTAFRSIATDSKLFPKGGLCFIRTQLPDKVNINPLKKWKKAGFFTLNQDTGGAIKGPARADVFCGNNQYARFTAGHMNQYGKLFFLVLN